MSGTPLDATTHVTTSSGLLPHHSQLTSTYVPHLSHYGGYGQYGHLNHSALAHS